jgi:prolyl-tRNA editing enzyme YbaK/EbsC (Cys-tRNA(Pro) deacylase)
VCAGFDATLAELNGEEDHVHLLVQCPPKVAFSHLVSSLKGVSSRWLRQDFAGDITNRKRPDQARSPPCPQGQGSHPRSPMKDPGAGDVLDDPCVRRVAAALAAFGVRGQITVLDDEARTARQAADALGIEIGQITNSLLFQAHRKAHGRHDTIQPLLVLVSGVHRVDATKVADLMELDAISLADAEFVTEHTGFTIGGVAPIAPSHAIETVVDVSLSRYGQVWAAAGHPRAVFPTSYDELLRLTGGHPAEVA